MGNEFPFILGGDCLILRCGSQMANALPSPSHSQVVEDEDEFLTRFRETHAGILDGLNMSHIVIAVGRVPPRTRRLKKASPGQRGTMGTRGRR